MSKIEKPHFYGTLEKGLKVLSLFDQKHSSLSLKAVSEMSGINKSSSFNLVNTLVELGFLSKDEQTKLIKVGPRAIILSHNLMSGHYVMKIVQKFISYTSAAHKLSIYAVILEKKTLISQFVGETFDYFDIISAPLEELCYCTALGKALLAYLPEAERIDILKDLRFEKRTEKTITNQHDLIEDLEKTRNRGYAINDEEYIKGIISIAAPFFDLRENRPIGAVCFDFYAHQYSLERIEKDYLNILLKLVKDISESVQR